MGRKAKLRAERREPLPRYFESARFGLVDTEDFKGCQVVKWNFEADEPWVLIDHEQKQLHINKRFIRPDISPEDIVDIANVPGAPITLSDAKWTNF